MRPSFIFLLLTVGIQVMSLAQPFDRISPSIYEGPSPLALPVAGGLNNPQLSEADLNQDGLPDLYLFDRTGNVHLTFLNDGVQYVFAPEYARYFPDLSNWVLLRDFNGDGAADIFAYSDVPGISGVAVYQGYYERDTLQFLRLSFDHPANLLPYPLPSGGKTQIFVSNIDYPAVDDVDCDGDLDILTFNIAGGYAELFQNLSLERGFGLDSLVFRLTDDCWGGFFESGITAEVDLAPEPGECAEELVSGGEITFRHAGSTLLTLDADGDQDRELLLGDLSFPLVNFLHNGGDCDQAWMDRQEVGFPIDEVSVDIDFFPAAFNLDLNFDGVRDLAFAPNAAQEAENEYVLWLYGNAGTEQAPQWQLLRSDFLVGDMLDFGSNAYPAFMDVNADGLLDLIVGNGGFYIDPGRQASTLWLYRNQGSRDQPQWRLVDSDFLRLSEFNFDHYHFCPAFGDLDGDGDMDIVVGEVTGGLLFSENIAEPGRPAIFGPWEFPYAGIDVGQESKPFIADLNGDDLPDLIIGEQNGNINFFQNLGSVGEPRFDPDPEVAPNTFFLGQIDTRTPGSVVGSSHPFVVKRNDKDLLIAGTENGKIELYEIDEDLGAPFPLLHSFWGEIREGAQTTTALADVDNDGLLEVAVGNRRGGLAFYQTDLEGGDPILSVDQIKGPEVWDVYPNPFEEEIWAKNPIMPVKGNVRVQLHTISGKRVKEETFPGAVARINTGDLPAGVYLISISDREGWFTKKMVKLR